MNAQQEIVFVNGRASITVVAYIRWSALTHELIISQLGYRNNAVDLYEGTAEERSRLFNQVGKLFLNQPSKLWPPEGRWINEDGTMTSTSNQEPKFTQGFNIPTPTTPVREKETKDPQVELPGRFNEITKARQYNSHPSGVEAKHLLRLMPFNLGTAMKYVLRAGLKGGDNSTVKDLRKAEFYALDEQANRTASRVGQRSYHVGTDLVNQLINYHAPCPPGVSPREWNSNVDHLQNAAIMALWHATVDRDDHAACAGALSSIRAMLHKAEHPDDSRDLPSTPSMEHAP